MYDTLLYLRSGGRWDTSVDQHTDASFSNISSWQSSMGQGMNLSLRWNYNNAANTPGDFLWSIGHITGDKEALEFGDWRNLEQATGPVPGRYGYDIPVLVYDALAEGSATNAGGQLCWGNTMTGAGCSTGGGSMVGLLAGTVQGYSADVNRSGSALFMQMMRGGNLLAWSNRVRVKHMVGSSTVYEDTSAFGGNNDGTGYSWGLISTMANMNGNTYLYPGGSESDGSNGRKMGAMADVLFMSQSFGDWAAPGCTGAACNTERWSKGTHSMIADTAKQMGIGILGGSLLFAADDLRLWLKDVTAYTSAGHQSGGVDLFSPRVRYNAKGLYGGARLPTGNDLIRIANIDMNLEGLLNLRFSPSPTTVETGKTAESNDYLSFSGAIRLRCGSSHVTAFGCNDKSGWGANNVYADSVGSSTASGEGSYISIEEPGKAGIDLRIADLSGDMAFTNGFLQMRTASDTNADAAPGSGNKLGTARADITLGYKILYGASAKNRLMDGVIGSSVGDGGAAGRPLTSNVKFGGNDILSMAIPAGSSYYSLTLRAQ